MAVLRDVLRTTLENDAALALILTGGIYDASEMGYDGGGSSNAPRQTNGVDIQPHCVIRFGASTPELIRGLRPEQQSVEFHLYQQVGYDKIDAARARIKALLDDKQLAADDTAFCYCWQIFISPDLTADELSGASHRLVRYMTHLVLQ